MRRQFLCFFLLACIACHPSTAPQSKRASIYLSSDSQRVCIGGLAYSVIQELKKDTLTRDAWQSLFPVYKLPADTTMKDFQKELPGTYLVTDSGITFKPDTAFKIHQQYVARFYGDSPAISTLKLLQKKADLKGPEYVEAVFKF